MSEIGNTWIPANAAVPDEECTKVEVRFADGEVLTGEYRAGEFMDPRVMVRFNGVKDWRPVGDGRKDL